MRLQSRFNDISHNLGGRHVFAVAEWVENADACGSRACEVGVGCGMVELQPVFGQREFGWVWKKMRFGVCDIRHL